MLFYDLSLSMFFQVALPFSSIYSNERITTAETTSLTCLEMSVPSVMYLPTLQLKYQKKACYLPCTESKCQHFNCLGCTLTHKTPGNKLSISPLVVHYNFRN